MLFDFNLIDLYKLKFLRLKKKLFLFVCLFAFPVNVFILFYLVYMISSLDALASTGALLSGVKGKKRTVISYGEEIGMQTLLTFFISQLSF